MRRNDVVLDDYLGEWAKWARPWVGCNYLKYSVNWSEMFCLTPAPENLFGVFV